MALNIRRARAADTAAILAINEGGRPGVTPLQFADIEAMQTAGWIWVADDVASIVGYLIAVPSGITPVSDEYRWFATTFTNFLYVDQIAVDVPHRRRRIASALYDSIERVAANNGFDRLVCEVNLRPANPSSFRFHTFRGFSTVGTLDASGERRVALMAKPLAG